MATPRHTHPAERGPGGVGGSGAVLDWQGAEWQETIFLVMKKNLMRTALRATHPSRALRRGAALRFGPLRQRLVVRIAGRRGLGLQDRPKFFHTSGEIFLCGGRQIHGLDCLKMLEDGRPGRTRFHHHTSSDVRPVGVILGEQANFDRLHLIGVRFLDVLHEGDATAPEGVALLQHERGAGERGEEVAELVRVQEVHALPHAHPTHELELLRSQLPAEVVVAQLGDAVHGKPRACELIFEFFDRGHVIRAFDSHRLVGIMQSAYDPGVMSNQVLKKCRYRQAVSYARMAARKSARRAG